MNIETKRLIAAKECGLELDYRGLKYLKKGRFASDMDVFICHKIDWKPDVKWDQFMYLAFNCVKLANTVIIPSLTPKDAFEIAITKLD